MFAIGANIITELLTPLSSSLRKNSETLERGSATFRNEIGENRRFMVRISQRLKECKLILGFEHISAIKDVFPFEAMSTSSLTLTVTFSF